MDFCPKCGRNLKDNEYRCPECGNMVREPPVEQQIPPEFVDYYKTANATPLNLKKMIFSKYFFIAFVIAFAAAFSITYLWRFSFLFFCIPLLIPMGRISIASGALIGVSLGTVAGLLTKYFVLNTIV